MAGRLFKGFQALAVLLRARLVLHAAERVGDSATLEYGADFAPALWCVDPQSRGEKAGAHMSGTLLYLDRQGLIQRPGGEAVTRRLRLTEAGQRMAEAVLDVVLPRWRELPLQEALYAGLERRELLGGLVLFEPPGRPLPECRVCGQPFRPRQGGAKTCSPACSQEAERRYRREWMRRHNARKRREKLESGDLGGALSPGPSHPWREPHH